MSRSIRVVFLCTLSLLCQQLSAQTISRYQFPKIKQIKPQLSSSPHHGFVKKKEVVTAQVGSSYKPLSVTSSQINQKGKITLSANLGTVIAESFTSSVLSNTPQQFSQLTWVGLNSKKLPQGILIRSIADSGKPDIPCLVFTCVVPEGAKNFRTNYADLKQQTLTSILLPPSPSYKDGTEGIRRYDAARYNSEVLSDQPIISKPIIFRRLRLVTVTVPLAQVQKNTVLAKTKFTCELLYDLEATPTIPKTDAGDPIFEDVYQSLVANPKDIASFRTSFRRKKQPTHIQSLGGSPITFDTSITSWIDQSAPYIKMTVTRTGLYRSTVQELVAQSGNNSITSWSASSLRLINHGKEIPVWVDSTFDGKINAIEFYGVRLPGFRNEYYNWDSDSNAYWLTNSTKFTTAPLRYSQYVASVAPSTTISEATLTQHHERDYFYYPGDKISDESQTTQRYLWVDGERFVWRICQDSASSVVDTFYLPALPADQTNKQATITVFLRGISKASGSSVSHHYGVVVNGTEIANNFFLDFDTSHVDVQVPLNLLHQGANTIAINYRQGTAQPDQWYTDYYRISLPTQLEPSADTSIAQGQWLYQYQTPASDYKLLLKSKLSAPTLYDLKNGLRISAGNSISPNYEFYLKTSSGITQINAATTSSFLKPDLIYDMTGKWGNILDTIGGADYILVAHPNFLSSAQKLALRRQSSGLRTKVVTTDEIFNAFNYGSNEPLAIRKYLQYAYDYYHGVPPSLVTLFGDGTWDPKFNLNNNFQSLQDRTSHQSFVPTFGVPSSDYIYSLSEGVGPFDSLYPEMVITRIPIESVDEAEAFIRKIVEYESALPADWNRNFLFVTGGDPPPSPQYLDLKRFVDAFLGDSSFYRNNYGGLKNFPLYIRSTQIMRTDLLSNLDATHVSEIQTAFQQGLSLVYFFGHGATNVTDILFPDVGTLRNQGLYPVFITLSCRTGAFAEPNLITLNESYMRGKESGVITSFGTTGFGEINYDFNMSARIFNYLRGDSLSTRSSTGAHVIKYPIVFTLSKYIESVLRPNSGLLYGGDNALYEYTILGDAAMGFAYRPQPEFEAKASNVTLTTKKGEPRSVYSVTDSLVKIHAVFNNYGYAPQGKVSVRITDELGGNTTTLLDSIDRLFVTGFYDATIALDTTMIGSHTLRIKIDALDQFVESNENDNEAIVTYLVSAASAIPLYPPEGAKNVCDVTQDSVRLLLIVPTSNQPPTIEIEADTTTAFTNPIKLGIFQTNGQFFDHTIARSLLPKAFSTVIWLRTRTKTPSGKLSDWQLLSIAIPDGALTGASAFSYTTLDQLRRAIISGLQADDAHRGLFIPELDTTIYTVEAHGVNDSNVINVSPISQIFKNGKAIYSTPFVANENFNGVAVAVLTADKSDIENVSLYWNRNDNRDSVLAALTDSFVNTINAVPAGRTVFVFTNFQPFIAGSDFSKPGFTKNPKVTTALQSLGSRAGFDSLQFFGSYVLIGHKGDPIASAKERFAPRFSLGVSLQDTVVLSGKKGIAQFPSTIVATGYHLLKWNSSNLHSGATLRLAVLGSDKQTGQIDTITTIDGSGASQLDLSSVNPLHYNKLSIGAELLRDSSSTDSPVLSSLELQYDIAPEYAIGKNNISATPSIIEEGFPAVVQYQCENILCTDGVNVPVVLLRNYNGKIDTVAKHIVALFAGRSSISFTDTVQTFGLQGLINYIVTINPDQVLNEQLAFNNTASTSIVVGRDSAKPKIDVVFDGHHINRDDYVSSKVKIEIRLSDSSPLRITDSASIGGVLLQIDPPSTSPIFFKGNQSQPGFITFYQSYPKGNEQASLAISPDPVLKPGTYLFTAFGKDVSGNKSDTIENEFIVSDKNALEHVMNYPNPFKDKTSFTFILRSAGQADVKVVVYTVAGRKIRTLHLESARQRVGLNAIEWDGKDEAGNDVANGTYIYKVVLNGINEDGTESSDAILERAVRSR